MHIRDALHGPILVDPNELLVIESHYFQRLRQIRQMGFAEYSFPSATHHRFIHSLGAMSIASRVFDSVFPHPPAHFIRLRAALRLATLLHDLGHGPLSHTTEFAMPRLSQLSLPTSTTNPSDPSRQATHEDYTLKMILDSGLTALLDTAGAPFGFKAIHIAALIDPQLQIQDDFFWEHQEGQLIDFRPILTQIISSELDADRMDYLRRDSFYTGVSYGQFDLTWLLDHLTFHIQDRKSFLCLQHRALYAFEDFLLSRFQMFSMVYFHHKSVVFDEMLERYFASADCDYELPSNIEQYCTTNDAELYQHLAKSSNPWARRIVEQKPYSVLIELHSGIPATPSAFERQTQQLQQIEENLTHQKIDYIKATSSSELSKYARKSIHAKAHPIFICYNNHYDAPSYLHLEACTDLFQRYNEKRLITRLYVAPESLSQIRKQLR